MSNLEGGSAVLTSRTDGSDSLGVDAEVEVFTAAGVLPGRRLRERR